MSAWPLKTLLINFTCLHSYAAYIACNEYRTPRFRTFSQLPYSDFPATACAAIPALYHAVAAVFDIPVRAAA